MNRIYILPEEIASGRAVVTDTVRVGHVNNILKASVNDELKVVVVDRGLGNWRLVELSKGSMTFELGELNRGIETTISLTVALCRPPTAKKILEHGTSLGVNSFFFFPATLTEKSYSTSKVYTKTEYLSRLCLGLAQSNVFYKLPLVEVKNSFDGIIRDNCQNILLAINGKPMSKIEFEHGKKINFIIGPERGFTEEEESCLMRESIGIKVSNSTLRTEIATFAALSQLELLI